MTPSALRTELALLMGNRSDYSTSRQYTHITFAQNEILHAIRVPEVQASATTPLDGTTPQRGYQLPTDTFAIISVSYPTSTGMLRKRSYEYMDRQTSWPTGAPAGYMRWGNVIFLDHNPGSDEDGNSLQIRYTQTVGDVTASTTSFTLPSPYHEAILLGALYRAHRSFREYEQAVGIKNEYLALVRSRLWTIEEESLFGDDFPLQVRFE